MHKVRVASLLGTMLLVLLLAACDSYTQVGSSTTSDMGPTGGSLHTKIGKANGTSEQSIETESSGGLILEADVTLSVGKGTFKIELLGEDDAVTLTLEASDGQTVSGQGQMVADAFGEATYRVTATEAENVEYTIEYTFR